MTIDWTNTRLTEGLALYNLSDAATLHAQRTDTQSELFLALEGLEDYVKAWSIEDGVWLLVAVVRMITEILDNYPPAVLGGNPTDELVMLVPLEHEQEIVHRILTAYQEFYHLQMRQHAASGNRFWHRKTAKLAFPELLITIEDNEEA